MKLIVSLSFFIVIFNTEKSLGQDSLRTHFNQGKSAYYISGGLLGIGLLINGDKTKTAIQDWVIDRYYTPNTKIDDYLQYTPVAMIGLYNWGRKTSKAEWQRQTRHFLISQGIALGTTYLLKFAVNAKRPSGGSLSFPSGHTTHVFAAAGVIYKAYKDQNAILAISGYLPAITTAVLRVTRDKHWVSDVVFGAGLGILASHLTYDLNIWNSGKRIDRGTSSNASIGIQQNGIGISVTFR